MIRMAGVAMVIVAAGWMAPAQEPVPPDTAGPTDRIAMPGSPLGIAWGMIYGFPLQKPVTFMPQVRQLGAGFTKVNLFWSQLEPEKGHYNWEALDPYLDQILTPEEGLLALFSSSPWATQKSTWVFPPSPAKNLDEYYRFIHDVVVHCNGRIRYFQNDSEPNNPMFWSGTREEYVAALRVFYKAVKDADPHVIVVLGGCDGLFGPPGEHSIPGQERVLAFADHVLKEASQYFDVFDIHLYSDPYTIPARVEIMRQKMAALGYSKPIISTEYNGPGFFEIPANRRYFGLLQSWSQSTAGSGTPAGSPGGKTEAAGIPALYEKMASLPPETRMFLMGCPEPLERKLERLQARDLVIRNVLAFSAGVQKTAFWDLWHDTSKRDDITTLLYGKLKLVEYKEGTLTMRYHLASVFQRMAGALDGLESVRRISVRGKESVYLFEAVRRNRRPVYIVWDRRDVLSGEEGPAIPVEWDAHATHARALDALGQQIPVIFKQGRLTIAVSAAPIFVETGS